MEPSTCSGSQQCSTPAPGQEGGALIYIASFPLRAAEAAPHNRAVTGERLYQASHHSDALEGGFNRGQALGFHCPSFLLTP